MIQKTPKVSQKWGKGSQKWAQGCQKWAQGSQKGAQGRQKGAQGSQKGAQGEANISHQIRVRGRVVLRTNFRPRFGAIFDEKNDKKAMRSYTVFKYPKMVDFSMEKRSRNEAKKWYFSFFCEMGTELFRCAECLKTIVFTV